MRNLSYHLCYNSTTIQQSINYFIWLYIRGVWVPNLDSFAQWTRMLPFCHTSWCLMIIRAYLFWWETPILVYVWETSSRPPLSTIKDSYVRWGVRNYHAPCICLASHLISSHHFYIYICRPGLAVPMNGHYLILLSNLWSHIPAHCPFMIETLILYSYTSAKSLQQSYHSLREKLQSSLVRFGLTRPKLPISGLWRLAVGHAVTTVTWPLSTY